MHRSKTRTKDTHTRLGSARLSRKCLTVVCRHVEFEVYHIGLYDPSRINETMGIIYNLIYRILVPSLLFMHLTKPRQHMQQGRANQPQQVSCY